MKVWKLRFSALITFCANLTCQRLLKIAGITIWSKSFEIHVSFVRRLFTPDCVNLRL